MAATPEQNRAHPPFGTVAKLGIKNGARQLRISFRHSNTASWLGRALLSRTTPSSDVDMRHLVRKHASCPYSSLWFGSILLLLLLLVAEHLVQDILHGVGRFVRRLLWLLLAGLVLSLLLLPA